LLQFCGINIGLPVVLKVGIWLYPMSSFRASAALGFAVLILAANLWRGISSASIRPLYFSIAGLNVLSCLLMGNIAILLSLGHLWFILKVLLG
jgi:hypothetical protein